MDLDELKRQVEGHIRGLRSAGVDWVPRIDPRSLPPIALLQESVAAEAEPAADPNSLEGRRLQLQLLTERVAGCMRCGELASTRTQTVFGVGPVGARILFLGEAPGADEDRQGEPFVGAAGQLLDRIIRACGLKRQDIFICNILRCRPPGNRKPAVDEAKNCREYLDRTIELVGPEIICCWGATAAQNLLHTDVNISRLRGRFYEYKSVPVLCTFHPAALLEGRKPELKKDVWEDMKMMLTRLGLPIPPTKSSSGE